MNAIRDVIFLIGVGLTLAFSLIVYAHSNFATKGTVQRIEKYQSEKEGAIIKRLDRIESKIDRIRK